MPKDEFGNYLTIASSDVAPVLRKKPVSKYLTLYKRLFDITFAVILLVALSPILVGLWIWARMDGGPGFYGQARLGQHGKIFTCWKFRTMKVNASDLLVEICANDPERKAEWDMYQKLKDDPRVTRAGKFLRRSSLDELPQLWNVLIGDMSFVGPRPMMTDQEALYRSGGGGDGYFTMRPGITGPWQIDGRGTTRFVDRIRFDNSYASDVSFWTDVKYIIRTVTVVLRPTGQ